MGEHRLGQRLGPTDTSSVVIMLLSHISLPFSSTFSLSLLSPLTLCYMERCYLNDAPFRCFDRVSRIRELEKDTGDVFLILWQNEAPVGMPAKSGKKFCPWWGSNPRPSVWYARLLPLGHAAPQYTFRALTAGVGPKSKI